MGDFRPDSPLSVPVWSSSAHPRIQRASECKAGLDPSEIPSVDPDSTGQSGTTGQGGEDLSGQTTSDRVASRSQSDASAGRTFTVYRFYDAAGTLLYVGQSYRIEKRLGQHRAVKPWWQHIARIELEHFATAEAMAQAEAEQIRSLQPLYNIMLRLPASQATRVPDVWREGTPERAKQVPEPYLRPREVADALGWTESQLFGAVADGCPAWSIGRLRRFKWSEVQEWLKERDL